MKGILSFDWSFKDYIGHSWWINKGCYPLHPLRGILRSSMTLAWQAQFLVWHECVTTTGTTTQRTKWLESDGVSHMVFALPVLRHHSHNPPPPLPHPWKAHFHSTGHSAYQAWKQNATLWDTIMSSLHNLNLVQLHRSNKLMFNGNI